MGGNVIAEVLYTTAEVAKLLGRVSPKTVANWRYLEIGPPWVRYGGRVFYKASEFALWEDQQQNLSAAEHKSARRAAATLQGAKSALKAPRSVVADDKIAADPVPNVPMAPLAPSPVPPGKVRRPNLSRRIASSLQAAIAKLQASLANESDQQASVRLVESIGFLNQLLAHKRYSDAQPKRR